MPVPITGIDHVIVGVHDLEAAQRQWAKLGFTMTPRGRHNGWGTANYCIMFEDDYVELLGIIDPSQDTNKLDQFLKLREGLMGLAFSAETAESVSAALESESISYKGPADLSRLLEMPEGDVEPAFKLVHLNGATPGVSSFVVQHLTRDLVWRPEWTGHANGVTGIESMTVVVEDASAIRASWEKLLGEDAVTEFGDQEFSVQTGTTELRFLTENAAKASLPELKKRKWRPPFLAAMALSVGNLDQTAKCLDSSGIKFSEADSDTLAVAGTQANGVSLEFCAI